MTHLKRILNCTFDCIKAKQNQQTRIHTHTDIHIKHRHQVLEEQRNNS